MGSINVCRPPSFVVDLLNERTNTKKLASYIYEYRTGENPSFSCWTLSTVDQKYAFNAKGLSANHIIRKLGGFGKLISNRVGRATKTVCRYALVAARKARDERRETCHTETDFLMS